MIRFAHIVSVVGALMILSGCTPRAPQSEMALPVIEGPPPMEKNRPYRIGAGDELAIKFFFAPELNDTLHVRPDGKISLPFAEGIVAAGRTPEELGRAIHKKIQRTVKQPDVVVVVRHAASSRAFVGGEVAKAGSVALRGNETLLQVLNEAGWVTPAANRHEVALVRHDHEGRARVYELDLDKITNSEDTRHNVVMQAGDIVMVPPSDITSFDRWVDQYIRLATPLPGSFVITNQTNHSLK